MCSNQSFPNEVIWAIYCTFIHEFQIQNLMRLMKLMKLTVSLLFEQKNTFDMINL